MIRFFNGFVKVTGIIPYWICFRTKVYYMNKKVQNSRLKGPTVLISNHTSVFDYAAYLGVFVSRTLRFQMAEVLFKNKFLAWFLRSMGGIYVDRGLYNFSFVDRSVEILNEGGVVGVFPESRIPKPGEERPLPFKPSAASVALRSGAQVVPVYTDGCYFKWKRARVIIGTPFYAKDFYDESLSEKENLRKISNEMRNKILELKDEFERQTKKA